MNIKIETFCVQSLFECLFYRVQLNEEQLEVWHEEEDDASDRMPHDGVTSKTCAKDELGADEVVSKSSGGKEDRNQRNGGKEAPKEDVVNLEKHLLACRSSLVHRKRRPCYNGPAENQPSSSSTLREQSPFSSTNVAAENQPSISQLCSKTPLGLRAHITLGCTKGVRPMQTGLDQV